MKFINVILLSILVITGIGVLSGCDSISPSPTNSNPTSESTFTPHPTFTSTPIPYELEVQVVTEDGSPLQNAKVTIKELGSSDEATALSDNEGKVRWETLNE